MHACAGNELGERLAFYGIMSNMVIYMTRVMHYDPAFASVQLMLFEGTCYLTPILGAWLADSRWGRFKCILVFSIIYFVVGAPLVQISPCGSMHLYARPQPLLCFTGQFRPVALLGAALGSTTGTLQEKQRRCARLRAVPVLAQGMLALALSAWVPGVTPGPDDDNAKWFQTAALFGALYIVALGTGVSVPLHPVRQSRLLHAACRPLSSTGSFPHSSSAAACPVQGIKPNVSAFGADQFDESDPQVRMPLACRGWLLLCRYAAPVRWKYLTRVLTHFHACQTQDRLEQKSFFNWFSFAINWGSCIAVTVIVYIQVGANPLDSFQT